MKNKSNHRNLYTFLEESGVLETGSDEDIELARKKYWREYKRKWARDKRKSKKQVTISLNAQEYKLILQSAKTYGRNTAQYVKDAVLAYGKKQYLIPDPMILNYIREAFTLNYNAIAQLEQEQTLSFETEHILISKLDSLERIITEKLKHPKDLEQAIIEAVSNNPEKKAHFLDLLENLNNGY
jgi:uncharacterized protein (DUF1778 family)